jgi:hypothetical protein
MEKFANLSPPVKWTLGVVGVGALVGTGAAIMSGAWMFILILVSLLVVLLGGYVLWTAWRRKLRSAQLGGELAQHSSASPRGISDPGQRARLDDMRKKFETGVREYKARGKDLYKLPWYAIVGEPGSGKTEAVRHSNVGFPPGMQDEFQGVGGTINMNWWFTNHAVLLDTAGRLMFEEVKPGETSEWKEFLTLLKKNRPNCPINGLLLVIPSDSLIKDSADDIQRKAGKIAQQLDVIQRVLDVRFPVFVIVTKCDKVNGFREFFDGVTDPQLQHQMMGWSNPSPLDDPFRPDLVDQHLNQVVQRLRKRRLGLLRDPVPENANGRRTDEVDSLYALPHSLSLIAPRLRRYLETIFVAGEWSSKPLFLRGIYFSSSMREGSALDAELAEAIGMPVDELPEGKVWERERAYFLRDLFVEKVFRERGLVTRASNTARMLRTQQVVLFGCSAAALVLFVFFAWFGTRNLEGTVKKQSDVWVNATNWYPNKTWQQSIIPLNADGSYADYATNQMEASGKKVSLGEFHARLREQATNEMKANWLMPGLAGQYNRDSKKAQRIVFEGGVIKPLVEAARKKMERALTSDAAPERGQSEAFAALLRIEGDLLTRDVEANKGEMDKETARRFLSSLYTYVTGQEPAADTNFLGLVDVMAWTYSENAEGRGKWPPAALSGSAGNTNSLANNPAIRVALDLYLRNARTNVQNQFKQWNLVSEIVQLVEKVQATEPLLFDAVKKGRDQNAEEHAAALNKVKVDLDKKLDEARQSPVFRGGVSLTNAYARFTGLVGSGGELDKVRAMAEKYRQQAAPKDQFLFGQILERLRGVQAEVAGRLQEVTVGNAKNFPELDKSYLVSPGFVDRGGFYQDTFKLADARQFQGAGLVGDKADKWQRFTGDTLARLQKQAVGYNGEFKASFDETAVFLLKRTERIQRDQYLAAYMEEAGKKLGEPLGFPLAKSSSAMMKPEQLRQADTQLTLIAQDLNAAAMPKASASENAAWNTFASRAATMARVSRAILGEELTPGECTISLMKAEESTRSQDAWRETGAWRDIRLIGNRTSGGRTGETEDQKLGAPTVDQRLTLQLVQNANADPKDMKTSDYPLGEWGAIALLHKSNNPQKIDPTTWAVNWPVRPADGTGLIRLKLKFDRPFPELESWPAK